ncbi:MAG: pyridoxamine 5'-phosphate oxidase family protein [Ruminococcaceae bacterium]|nr:pyridoxamine 5'-phosphate oxidase family protein [Oscillospiraceae bacterium]
MFRELVRKKQEISQEACREILMKETRGILTVNGDGGYPYATPMNHYYCAEDGCIYFHCGRAGHRLDALRRSDKVCFCVCERGERKEGQWAYDVRSVVTFGRMEIIDDINLIIPITTALSRKFTDDEAYIEHEIKQFSRGTLLLKLIPEHMCGKLVNES